MTDGTKPLLEAVFRGELERVADILQAGTDVNEVDRDGRTALHHAAIDGNREMATYLIGKGADIDLQDGIGYTALHYSAQNGWGEITSLLIEKGATIDVQDNHGNTPLWKAVFSYRDDVSTIQQLVSAGASPTLANAHGISPKELAITKGDELPAFD